MFPKKYLFPLLAFVLPLLVRFIPEILMGPYVVGFDTMGYYIPTTSFVAAWRRELLEFHCYSTFTVHFDCWVDFGWRLSSSWVLKVLPSCASWLFRISHVWLCSTQVLGWSPKKSIIPALLEHYILWRYGFRGMHFEKSWR